MEAKGNSEGVSMVLALARIEALLEPSWQVAEASPVALVRNEGRETQGQRPRASLGCGVDHAATPALSLAALTAEYAK